MKLSCMVLSIALLSGTALAQPTPPPATNAAATGIDPAAVAAVERSRAYLRTLKSFEVRAFGTMQEVLDDGTKIDLTTRVRYEYRAPDRLFIGWQSDNAERRLYYNGRKLTVFMPRIGYYAQVDATGSVSNLLQKLATDYGVIFPLPDLFLWAASDAPAYNVQSAAVVGPARIADADTDHYLFRQQDVDWQIWIQRGDRPVPRKIVITDRSDPAQPSFSALLQWNPDVQLGDERFEFTPTQALNRIEMAKLSQEKKQ